MNKIILFFALIFFQVSYGMILLRDCVNENDWIEVAGYVWRANRDEAARITKLLIDSHKDLNMVGKDKSYLIKDLLEYLKIPLNISITEEKNTRYETMRIVIRELVKYGKLDPKIPFIQKGRLHKKDKILKSLCESVCEEISKDE